MYLLLPLGYNSSVLLQLLFSTKLPILETLNMDAFLMVILPKRFFATAPGLVSKFPVFPIIEELGPAMFFVSSVPKIASAASLNDICAPKVDEPAAK